jgi:hypothetical protein
VTEPCPGCGVFFPEVEGPTHRYMGASAGCWALFTTTNARLPAEAYVLAGSSVPPGAAGPSSTPGTALEPLFVDAYAVQHHGDRSAQAIQSVAIHLMTLHGVLARGVDVGNAQWIRLRTGRDRNLFEKLEPPPLGSALTIRHLFPGGGVTTPCERGDYIVSVYEAWMNVHRALVEDCYGRFVLED